MSLNNLFLVLSFLFFLSCKRYNGGEIVTSNGYVIQFHELSPTTKAIFKGCVVNLDMIAKDLNDNIIFSSKFNGLQGVSSFYYDSSLFNSPLNEVFDEIHSEDSVSFKLTLEDFYNSFFNSNLKLSNRTISLKDTLRLSLKVLGFNSIEEQSVYNFQLLNLAVNSERKLLNETHKIWDSKYLNLFKYEDLYSIKLSSEKSLFSINDSMEQFISINYSIEDLNGRILYTTNSISEYYDKSLNGQLLKGFKILVDQYDRGDSVMAIVPSNLLFGKRGSFVNKIPPFTPVKVNMKIN